MVVKWKGTEWRNNEYRESNLPENDVNVHLPCVKNVYDELSCFWGQCV